MKLMINCKSFDNECIDVDDAFDALIEEAAYKKLECNDNNRIFTLLLFLKKYYKEVLSKNKIKNDINIEKVKIKEGIFNRDNYVLKVENIELIRALYNKFILNDEFGYFILRTNNYNDNLYLMHYIKGDELLLLYEGKSAKKVAYSLNYLLIQYSKDYSSIYGILKEEMNDILAKMELFKNSEIDKNAYLLSKRRK